MDEERLERVARRHGIRLIVKFGSAVTGRVHAGSDLDLGVFLERVPRTATERIELTGDLQELAAGTDVDVAIINRADPLFLKQIMQRCELIYGDRRTLAELKMLAFRRYQDHRPYLEMESRYVRRVSGME